MGFLTFTIWKDLSSMISLMEPKYCENLETRFCVMLSIHSPPISLSPATCILVTPSRTLKILSCRVWESKNVWWLGIWQRKFSLNYHCQAPHQLLMAMQWNEHQIYLDKHNCPSQGVTPAWKKRKKCFDLFSNSLI